MMRRCNSRRAGGAHGITQRPVTGFAGPGLKIAAGCNRNAGAVEGNAASRSELGRSSELERRLWPQAVVDSVSNHGQPEPRSDDGEDVEERRRVASAAHRDENAFAALDPAFLFQRSPRERDERRRVRSRHLNPLRSRELEALAELEGRSGFDPAIAMHRVRIAFRARAAFRIEVCAMLTCVP
jgi:hypothetical protein